MFALHERLAADTFFVADLKLCSLLLMNNRFFPWLLLVPRVEGVREIIDLPPANRHALMDEIADVSRLMQELFTPDKLNVAALGNQVPQLHVHLIARYRSDSSWPNPVWGGVSEKYDNSQEVIDKLVRKVRTSNII